MILGNITDNIFFNKAVVVVVYIADVFQKSCQTWVIYFFPCLFFQHSFTLCSKQNFALRHQRFYETFNNWIMSVFLFEVKRSLSNQFIFNFLITVQRMTLHEGLL